MRGDGSQRPAAKAWAWLIASVWLVIFLAFAAAFVYAVALLLA